MKKLCKPVPPEDLIKQTLRMDRMDKLKAIKEELKEARLAGEFYEGCKIYVVFFAPGSAIPEITITGFPYQVHETKIIDGKLRVSFAPEAERIAVVMRRIVKKYHITDFYFSIKKAVDSDPEGD
jgi:hypothetical protein